MIKRRITQSVILLFCSSLGMAQVNVEHALFNGSTAREYVPSFIVRLQESPGGSLLPRTDDATFSQVRMNASADSAEADSDTASGDSTRPSKSPTLAMLLSMVVPGSGQVYVHRYITIPIIWGFGIYFAKAWNDQNKRYIYYRDLFTASVHADSLHQGNGLYQTNRDFYRDDRDKFAFYLAITYVLNIVDAYVGASLYSFDVSDNLGGSAAIRLRIPLE